MAQVLYELIAQLTADNPAGKKLRRQFHDNPESVTKDLSPRGRRALYTMDQNKSGEISKHVKKEFENDGKGDEFAAWEDWFVNWQFPTTEFVLQGQLPADCRYETGPSYPSPKPFVYDIAPRSEKAGPNKTVEVVVVGQGLVSGRTRLELKKQGSSTLLKVVPKYSGIEGSFRCGHLYADVDLPGSVAAAEVYDIRVIITTGTDQNGNPVEWDPLPVRKDMGATITFTVNP